MADDGFDGPCVGTALQEDPANRAIHSRNPVNVAAEYHEHLMLRSVLALTLLATSPALAQSAAQEARFSDAIQAMEARSFTFYVSVDPQFALLLAPTTEDPAFRDSQRCVLSRIEEEGGSDMLEEYIAAMEEQSASESASLIELGGRLPAVMISDLVFAASAECGAMSHTTTQMMTPEFLALMAEPQVMQGLMGGPGRADGNGVVGKRLGPRNSAPRHGSSRSSTG